MVKPRALQWIADDDGVLVALNPYPDEGDSSLYATRYLVRRAPIAGYVATADVDGAESPLGTFDDADDARAAAQGDADQNAGVDAVD
jgi:hypothetical protein